mgnify:CR=1 FL=1
MPYGKYAADYRVLVDGQLATAERFGASFRGVTVQVGPGPNLEARAREARYAALPADVLTGHTADDQAETVAMRAAARWPRGDMAMPPSRNTTGDPAFSTRASASR